MTQLLSLFVENKSGVLARVVGLFSQRGYNIETLNVAPTEDPTISLITLSTTTDQRGTEQVIKQINKLIEVLKVVPFDPIIHVAREMSLVRVRVSESNRLEIIEISKSFRARVLDSNAQSCIFEMTEQPKKIDSFLQKMRAYGVLEIHRTGRLSLGRCNIEKKKDRFEA